MSNTAKAVLGPDLLAVDQFITRPGGTREINRKSHPETTAIGIFAGYRDLPNSVWRVVHKMLLTPDAGWYRAVIPANKAVLTIDLQGSAIVVTDVDAGTRPTQFANESLKGLDQNPPDATPHPEDIASGLPDARSQGLRGISRQPATEGFFESSVEHVKKPLPSLR